MIAFLLSLAFLAGAVLRRMFGGWLGWSRSVCAAMIVVASAAPFWWRWGGFGDVLVFGTVHLPQWSLALAATAAVWIHWVQGHDFSKPWALAIRYSVYGPIPLAILTWWWPLLAVGPVVAISAAVFRLLNLSAASLPWDTDRQRMLDGWEGYWEMVLGGTSIAAFLAASLYGAGFPP